MGVYLPMTHVIEAGQERVVFYSEDTDVFMMALAFHNNIRAYLLQKCGPKTRTRVINIRNLCTTTHMPTSIMTYQNPQVFFQQQHGPT